MLSDGFFSVHCIMRHMILVCFIPGEVNLDHLIEEVSVRFLHCKNTHFSLGCFCFVLVFGFWFFVVVVVLFFGCFACLFVCFCFLGPHPWHTEVPRLGIKLELQLLAYVIAIAMRDLS